MEFKVPEELKQLLAAAPANPNPAVLDLLRLRIGTKFRYIGENGHRIIDRVESPPFEVNGCWNIILGTRMWSLYDAGLVPARLADGSYSWNPHGIEYRNPISRFLYRIRPPEGWEPSPMFFHDAF